MSNNLGALPFSDCADDDPNGQLRIPDSADDFTERDLYGAVIPDGDTYPRVNEAGETVWACCESSIGPECQHRRVLGWSVLRTVRDA